MSKGVATLSTGQARRIALAAQGFLDKPHDPPTMRTLARTVDRTGVLQVDSVNVLQRAHFMPLYSRMGAYDTTLLDRAASGREKRRLVEYWAHVQAFMPVELWPVMQHRMADYRKQRRKWLELPPDATIAQVLAEVAVRGPSTARDLDDGTVRSTKHWGWNWSDARKSLDWLFMIGDLAIVGRNSQFEVVYDIPERVLPDAVLAQPTPSLADAERELVRRAARSHGVSTVRCLADYYRTSQEPVRRAVEELVEEGELVPVSIQGWSRPAYLHRDARVPRKVDARALLSPFDPVVWLRERTEKLFDFHYRIEIYTPAAKRIYGYYVLPFLLGEKIVGRVDLKADRKSGRLVVKAAYAEPDSSAADPDEVAEELGAELTRLASWLGLDEVTVEPRGDLASLLPATLLRS